jgi:hypothetical protein
MKNPFLRTNTNGLWVAAIAVTALAAGALAWFYFKKNEPENANAHLNYPYVKDKGGRKKKAKTDVHDLHVIAPAGHEEHQQ